LGEVVLDLARLLLLAGAPDAVREFVEKVEVNCGPSAREVGMFRDEVMARFAGG
jgi:hypothetical protein